MASLFDRDIKTIGKHVKNAIEEELEGISVGYRVKSKRGIEFRKWANSVLKQYILKGYAVFDRVRCHHGSFLKFITSTFSSASKVIVPFLM